MLDAGRFNGGGWSLRLKEITDGGVCGAEGACVFPNEWQVLWVLGAEETFDSGMDLESGFWNFGGGGNNVH